MQARGGSRRLVSRSAGRIPPRGAVRTHAQFFAWQTDGCSGVVGERFPVVRKRPLSRKHRGNCESKRARM
eukprot:945033-Pyramimonas_sp.AAC.1